MEFAMYKNTKISSLIPGPVYRRGRHPESLKPQSAIDFLPLPANPPEELANSSLGAPKGGRLEFGERKREPSRK